MFIKLTSTRDSESTETYLFNIDVNRISYIQPVHYRSTEIVTAHGEKFLARETPEEILKLIKEATSI